MPLNAWWTGEELEYGLRDCGARFLFCDADRAERIAPPLGALRLEGIVVARGESPLPQAISFAALVADAADTATLPDVRPHKKQLRIALSQLVCAVPGAVNQTWFSCPSCLRGHTL